MNRDVCRQRPDGSRRAKAFGLCLLLILAVPGGAAAAAQWRTNSIRGVMPNLEFTLVGERGNPVHGHDYRGRTTLLYFGYTHCPDVCPLTLAKITQAMKDIGQTADGVRVLFVSVDPARDSPQKLAAYTSAFDPRIVGLTGTRAQLDALTKRYRVAYRYGKKDDEGNYPVYHSAGIFVFDRQGRARLLMNAKKASVADIRHDLGQLLRMEGGP